MDFKFLNPFVESAHDVLSIELHETIHRGNLSLESGPYSTDDVTVIISMVGAVEGTVLISMSKATALQLSSSIIGERLENLDRLAQSGIAELGNVIVARASMRMAESGLESNISTPSLIVGNGATISTLDYPRLVVPFNTSAGALVINLALREGLHTGFKAPQIVIPKPFDPSRGKI